MKLGYERNEISLWGPNLMDFQYNLELHYNDFFFTTGCPPRRQRLGGGGFSTTNSASSLYLP